MNLDWTTIITFLISTMLGAGGVGTLLNRKLNKRMAKAQAMTSEWELYEKQIDDLQETVTHLNTTEKNHAERIHTLNKALDDKTDRIRKLTDQMYESERCLNVANSKITQLTAKIGDLELQLEKYKNWHCRKSDCEFRLPPSPGIKGKSWEEHEAEQSA